jgi:hypothetical protein
MNVNSLETIRAWLSRPHTSRTETGKYAQDLLRRHDAAIKRVKDAAILLLIADASSDPRKAAEFRLEARRVLKVAMDGEPEGGQDG